MQKCDRHIRVKYWTFTRDYVDENDFAIHGPDCTLDVDHHARACWWSTSESSEKCPRVMRGNMSVPSENSNFAHLSAISAEFDFALRDRVNLLESALSALHVRRVISALGTSSTGWGHSREL
jgi:hypothetical protein